MTMTLFQLLRGSSLFAKRVSIHPRGNTIPGPLPRYHQLASATSLRWGITARCLASGATQSSDAELMERRKNSIKSRPLSPHITIYAWPLAAISSIGVRITGGLLSVGMYGIGIGALAGVDMAEVMHVLGTSSVGPLVKFAIAFPVLYHIGGGVRHLYWEKRPEGLSVVAQYRSSVAIIAVTGLLSLAASVV